MMQKIAKNLFERQGKVIFMAVLITPNGDHHPMVFEDLEKEEIGRAIRQHVKHIKPEVVVIIAEAWAIVSPFPDGSDQEMTEDQLRQYALKYGTVEKHKWSQDCLTLDFEFSDGSKEGWHWYIVKDKSGTRILLDDKFQRANGTRVLEVSGHLQDFF